MLRCRSLCSVLPPGRGGFLRGLALVALVAEGAAVGRVELGAESVDVVDLESFGTPTVAAAVSVALEDREPELPPFG